MRTRDGFTLLEAVIATTVFSIVIAGVMSAFFGMRTAQGSAVTSSELKIAGQTALKRLYKELSQSRKLLANLTTDPAGAEIGREYFNMLSDLSVIATLDPIPGGNMKYPRINPVGGFGQVGTGSGQLDPATVGNTLAFVKIQESLAVKTAGVLKLVGVIPVALSSEPFYLSSYRFVFYYPAEGKLPPGAPAFKNGMNYTLQLMRYESASYLDKGEFETLASKLVLPTDAYAVYKDMAKNHGIKGLWDSVAATAADSIYTVNSVGAVEKVVGPKILKERETLAVSTGLSGYALPTLAFNDSAQFAVEGMKVPTFAVVDPAAPAIPYGFEVAIAGPSGARTVLLRLSLAARLNAGLRLFGYPHQGVVKVFDM